MTMMAMMAMMAMAMATEWESRATASDGAGVNEGGAVPDFQLLSRGDTRKTPKMYY